MRMGTDEFDLCMAISWNETKNVTYVLILGCREEYAELVEDFMAYSQDVISHALLPLALFAELQLKLFRKLERDAMNRLNLALFDAGLEWTQGVKVLAVADDPKSVKPETDYDRTVRDVLYNVRSSGHLLRRLLLFRSQLCRMIAVSESCDIDFEHHDERRLRRAIFDKSSKRLNDQLTLLLEQLDDLIERGRMVSNESSLYMSAVFSLIAQQDNRINQEIATESRNIADESKRIASESKELAKSSADLAKASKDVAEDSREIAKATKWDSTSMKAIASLTMVFLPATFTSVGFPSSHMRILLIQKQTLLAMPMFNWQRKPDEVLLTFGDFRIFLAIAIPLTAIVLSAWLIWQRWRAGRWF
jgi:hypothetical protein